jgi:hypothetical protein
VSLEPGGIDVGGIGELMWMGLWLLIAAIVSTIGAVLAARAVRARCERPGDLPPFGLHTLRELRASGQITEVEYNAIRDALADQVRKLAGPTSSGPSARPESRTPPGGGGWTEVGL